MNSGRSTVQPFEEITLPDGSDPVERGIVRRVDWDDGVVRISVAVEELGDQLAERIVEQIRGRALSMPQTEHARIVAASHADKDVELPEIETVIAVGSTKGGVGKTTVAVGLARTLAARGFNVGLFDADIYGPNVPHLIDGVEGPVLTDDEGRPVPMDVDGIQLLSPGLVAGDPPTARRGAIAYGAIENLLVQGAWDSLDVLFIDLPAGSDDVVGAALEHVPLDGAIFVTTPFVASVEDTQRTITLFEQNDVPAIAAVVNMNSVTCSCCEETIPLFEDPVELDVPALHEIPFDRKLQRDPGGSDESAFDGLAGTIEGYLESIGLGRAIDLRGLPLNSVVRQSSQELDRACSDESVEVVVDDPTAVSEMVRADAAELVGSIQRRPFGARGDVLAIKRA